MAIKANTIRTGPETKSSSIVSGLISKVSSFEKNPLFDIQKSYGNSYTKYLLDSGLIQAKLRINEPGDKYEKEADAVSELVVGTGSVNEVNTGSTENTIQKHPETVEETDEQESDEQDQLVRLKVKSFDNPGTINRADLNYGAGRTMPGYLRGYFEPRFGHDFSGVSLHTDSRANDSAEKLGARAFATENRIVFGRREYSPGTESGKKLIAHELTHVLQQSRPGISGESNNSFIQRNNSGRSVPQGLARYSFSGCNDSQNFFVDLARVRAPVWVSSAIAGLREILANQSGTVSSTQSVLNEYFHPPAGRSGNLATIGGRHQPETIRTIIRRLTRMRRTLENPGLFRCVSQRTCNSEMSSDADAYAGSGTVISLCPGFFDRSLTDQIIILIHESAHQIGLMRNVIGHYNATNLTLNQALTNADSYALFVVNNFLGPQPNQGTGFYPVQPPAQSQSWDHGQWFIELILTSPVRDRFYYGRGQSRLMWNERSVIETPFPQNRPINFSATINFYIDTPEIQKPPFEPVPDISTQVLFHNVLSQRTSQVNYGEDLLPGYAGPGRPVRTRRELRRINTTIRENGKMSFSIGIGQAGIINQLNTTGQLNDLLYNDEVDINPDNGI